MRHICISKSNLSTHLKTEAINIQEAYQDNVQIHVIASHSIECFIFMVLLWPVISVKQCIKTTAGNTCTIGHRIPVGAHLSLMPRASLQHITCILSQSRPMVGCGRLFLAQPANDTRVCRTITLRGHQKGVYNELGK